MSQNYLRIIGISAVNQFYTIGKYYMTMLNEKTQFWNAEV